MAAESLTGALRLVARPTVVEESSVSWPRELGALLALLCGLGSLWWVLDPAMIDGDSIGYLKLVGEQVELPGHLGLLPLFRAVAWLVQGRSLLDLYHPLRLLSVLAGLLTLGLLFDAARRLFPFTQALAATALLGVSWGFWRSAQQVETYAMATMLATATLWALLRSRGSRRATLWAAAGGLFAGLAVLFHLTLLLLAVPLGGLLWRWSSGGRRWRRPLLALVLMGFTAGLPFLLVMHHLGVLAPGAAWAWLHSSDHGLPYPMTLGRTPVELLSGLSRSLVLSPYSYDAALLPIVALTALGVLAWAVLGVLAWRAPRPGPPADLRLLLVWGGALALFGLSFFPADTERWIFLLPAGALLLARVPARRLVLVVIALGIINSAALLPEVLDTSTRTRAAEVDRLLRPGDLVVHPGHGWDELVGLGVPFRVYKFPFIYFIGTEGGPGPARRLLDKTMGMVFARGDRVFVARLRDTRDQRGWGMLEGQGVSRTGFAALFEAYRPAPTTVPGLWRLSPPRPPREAPIPLTTRH